MEFDVYNPKPWKISKQNQRGLSIRKVEQALSFFNRVTDGNFYVIDYQMQKLIVGASHNTAVAGYSEEQIRKENFDFLKRVWAKREIVWFYEMLREAFKIFYAYEDLQMRMEMELSFDMIAIGAGQQKLPCTTGLFLMIWTKTAIFGEPCFMCGYCLLCWKKIGQVWSILQPVKNMIL